MKRNKKNKKAILFLAPTFICMFLICILPLLFALIHVGTIKNTLIQIVTLILVIIFVLVLLFSFLEAIICILDVYNNKKMKKNTKIFWYVLLIFFNIFIIPYYYFEFMKNNRRNKMYKYIYIIIFMVFSILSIITTNILTNSYEVVEKKKEKKKEIDEQVRNIYASKDSSFYMSFKLGFKQMDVSEYDFYAKDENRNLVTGAFLYDISHFLEKTPEAVLNKQVDYFKNNRQGIEIFKNQSVRTKDVKTIYSIELKGKNEDSSDCIYKLSAISFNGNNTNIVYVIQVVLENEYDKYIKELDEIVDSLRLR